MYLRRGNALYRRAYEHSSTNPELEKELRSILEEAGITPKESELYLTPSAAKWEGEHRLGIEIRKGAVDKEITYFIHNPGNPYFGMAQAKGHKEAVQMMQAAKGNLPGSK